VAFEVKSRVVYQINPITDANPVYIYRKQVTILFPQTAASKGLINCTVAHEFVSCEVKYFILFVGIEMQFIQRRIMWSMQINGMRIHCHHYSDRAVV
jgi:hypothetical protein